VTLTLRELIAKHPEWLDYPICVSKPDGYDYVSGDDGNGAGSVFLCDWEDVEVDKPESPVVMFAAN
jgi:hypothetical protein